ncbi:RICIN domain-containing protein [Nostoc sp. CALU 1950]
MINAFINERYYLAMPNNISTILRKIVLLAMIVSASATLPPVKEGIAQSTDNRLRTQFTGLNKCLDIINDGENNKLIMAKCGNFSGQFWSIQPTQSRGYYRLRTKFTGSNKCLDIINDGENNKLIMAKCGNFSGQFWSIQPTQSRGYYRLRTQFTESNKCLDIINDGDNNKLIMAKCGNFSGQLWNLSSGL